MRAKKRGWSEASARPPRGRHPRSGCTTRATVHRRCTIDSVRTCVGCRTRAPRTALIRVVSRGLELVIDERKAAPGRGAWLHPSRECAENALRRRAFGRALRVSGPLDTQTFEEWLNGYGNKVNGSK